MMEPTQQTQVGWQDYVALFVRRKRAFLIPFFTILAGSLVMGLLTPKVYRAQTTILVQEANIMNPLIEGLAISTTVGDRLGLLRSEILSWSSLTRLITELGLDKKVRSPLDLERLVQDLRKDIQVTMRGSNLVMIAYEHQIPALTQKLVNSVSRIFLERNQAAQSSETGIAITFLEEEMAVYKKKLEESEEALREFRELYLTQMPVAVELNNQIVDLELQRAELLIENTDKHPAVIDVTRRIEDMKVRRDEEIKRFIAKSLAKGHNPQIYQGLLEVIGKAELQDVPGLDPARVREAQSAYEAWVKRLDQPTQETNPVLAPQQVQVAVETGQAQGEGSAAAKLVGSGPVSISLAPWQEQELARLTRDYEVTSNTYHHLQERLERAKITERLGTSDEGVKIKVLEPARLPLRPVRPKLALIGLFGLLLGAFVGAGAVFAAEYLDQSFQSAEDAQLALGVPVLGSISTIVTPEDIELRRRRREHLLSIEGQRELAKKWIVEPLARLRGLAAQQFDRLLVRWKV